MARSKYLIFVLLLIFNLDVSLFAQSNPVRMDNITVGSAMQKLKELAGYTFIFESGDVDTGQIVSVNAGTYAEAVKQVLRNQQVSYKMEGKSIVISKKEANQDDIPSGKVRISGKILDEKGLPAIGAAIIEKGNNSNGAITDAGGNFSIIVPRGAVLEVSNMGYETQEITADDNAKVEIKLNIDTRLLDEVVVTALGIKREEKALSYNVQQVSGKSLTAVKDANFVNSLNGKVAGVVINKSGSGVGGSTRVVMRGAKSLEGDNNALYVVDGIPLFNTCLGRNSGIMGEDRTSAEGISDFNPEDIESISVLSGPSAAALYGSNAANGVILITTKKGKEGALSLQFSSNTEFSRPYMMPEFQNTYGNKKDSYESWGNKLSEPSAYDPRKDFFETGVNSINSLILTTGTKKNQTFASMSSTTSKGIVPNNKYDRLNVTIRNTSTFLKDRVQLDLGASYINQKDRNMVSQGQYWNPVMAAYLFPRGENFDAVRSFERFDDARKFPVQYWPVSDPVFASQNPYWTAYRNVATHDKNRYMFTAGLSVKITDWLNATARYRLDDSYIKFEHKIYASSDLKFASGPKGHYNYSDYFDRQQYADFMLNIDKRFKNFSISSNIGWNYSDYGAIERGYKGTLLGVPNKFAISNIDPTKGSISETGGNSLVRNHAIFANVELGFKNMLYLTMTGRNDWNSRLVNTKSQSVFYPSVGLSAVVSEMVKLPKFISYFKLRGSYTEVGAPISRSGLTPGTVTTPLVGGALMPTGIYPFTDFRAELTKSYEFGASLRLWYKLSADVTYYHSNTMNQTFLGDLPEYTGYKQIYLQAGNVENRGWEASLSYNDTFMSGFGISSTLTFSRNVNEIKEMVTDYHSDLLDEPINIPEVRKEKGRVILKKGGSINDIYANTFFKKDSQGYVEVTGSGSYGLETGGEPVFLGRTTPDFNLGWSNSFSYKGVSLGFLITGSFGGVVTSSTEALLDRFGVSKRSAEARDAGGALLGAQGRVDAKTYYRLIGTGEWGTSGYYLYSATNIRLAELTLSYKMPDKWFGNVLKDVTLSFIANNPWMLYCKAPFDPALTPSTSTYGQGNDYFMQPSVRGFGFGVKVKF